MKGWHEGKADVSAEYEAPEEGTRISGENELEEWTAGTEETPGEGTQASYREQRVARLRQGCGGRAVRVPTNERFDGLLAIERADPPSC